MTLRQRGLAPLLENDTLAWFAWHYGVFDEELCSKLGIDGKEVFDRQGPCADVFEAYVGALYMDAPDNPQALNAWLSAVYGDEVFPTLREVVRGLVAGEYARPSKHSKRTGKAFMTPEESLEGE